jgi:uncharacterized protein (TIGR02246 family)
MKNALIAVLLVLLLGWAFGCQKQGKESAKEPEANIEADVAAIKALIDDWVRLYNAGDFERLVSVFYADNAILIAPDMPIRKGKEAILLGCKKADELSQENVDSSLAEEVRVSGDLGAAWGIDTGTSTPRNGGELLKYNVNWLMVFERQTDRTWKCIYEMWNDYPISEAAGKGEQNPS